MSCPVNNRYQKLFISQGAFPCHAGSDAWASLCASLDAWVFRAHVLIASAIVPSPMVGIGVLINPNPSRIVRSA